IGEKVREHAPCVMPDDLAIGEGTIDGGTHWAEITLANIGLDRRKGEFPVGKQYAARCRGRQHLAQEFRADLMAEATRPAMDGHHDLVRLKAEASGRLFIKHFADRLNLKIMIAGA